MNLLKKHYITLALLASVAGGSVVATPGETVAAEVIYNPALNAGLPLAVATTLFSATAGKAAAGRTAVHSTAVVALLAALYRLGCEQETSKGTTMIMPSDTIGGKLIRRFYLNEFGGSIYLVPQPVRFGLFASIATLTYKLVTSSKLGIMHNPQAKQSSFIRTALLLSTLVYGTFKTQITARTLKALGY